MVSHVCCLLPWAQGLVALESQEAVLNPLVQKLHSEVFTEEEAAKQGAGWVSPVTGLACLSGWGEVVSVLLLLKLLLFHQGEAAKHGAGRVSA
jgi:hypothetical protein